MLRSDVQMLVVKCQTEAELSLREFGTVALEFEVPMWTCSGIAIQQLHIPVSPPPHRWIRYMTQANSYVFRLA